MQQFFKNMIIAVSDMGVASEVYFGFHAMDFLAVFLISLWLGKKMGIGSAKGLLTVLIVYPIIYVWMLILFWVESGFKNFGGQHMVSVFIWTPAAALLAAKVLKIRKEEAFYISAPCMTLAQAIGHLGCIFTGCCSGYPVQTGLYNRITGLYHFPIQPVESAIALTIVLILVIRAKKHKFVADKLQYPIMLILYGSTRTVCEFYRDNTKVWMGWSKLAFHALFMTIVGIVWIMIVKRKEKAAKCTA